MMWGNGYSWVAMIWGIAGMLIWVVVLSALTWALVRWVVQSLARLDSAMTRAERAHEDMVRAQQLTLMASSPSAPARPPAALTSPQATHQREDVKHF